MAGRRPALRASQQTVCRCRYSFEAVVSGAGGCAAPHPRTAPAARPTRLPPHFKVLSSSATLDTHDSATVVQVYPGTSRYGILLLYGPLARSS